MSDLHDPFDAAGVEALLQAAGGYVGPSEDLRPRVLEEARRLRTEGRRRRALSLAGGSALALAAVIGFQASSMRGAVSDATPARRVAQLVAASDAKSRGLGVESFCWSLVDAFLTVRNEQADAFRATDESAPEAAGAPSAETSEGVAQMPAEGGSF